MKIKRCFHRLTAVIALIFAISASANAQDCSKPDPNNRTQINRLAQPYTKIVHLAVHRRFAGIFGYDNVSTCSFVGKNILVTAAHVFKHLGRVTDLTISIGQREENGKEVWLSQHHYDIATVRLLINPTFQQNQNPDFDYAYIALNENLSDTFFKITKLEDIAANIDSVHISGYPGDKVNQYNVRSAQLWTKGDKTGNIAGTDKVLLYSMFTYFGDSGAPIWAKAGPDYYLIGIHGTGVYGNGHQNCNAGIKFTADRLTELQQFIHANAVN